MMMTIDDKERQGEEIKQEKGNEKPPSSYHHTVSHMFLCVYLFFIIIFLYNLI